MKGFFKSICSVGLLIIICGFNDVSKNNNIITFSTSEKTQILKDSIDSLPIIYKPFKEKVHASYYHDKFNGRKTASGELFSNDAYTAAHKTLKFGTKLKITNTVNDSSVVVTVNDRGPFIKGREIDLSKKAFMEIAKFKSRGYLIVNIEIIEEPTNNELNFKQ